MNATQILSTTEAARELGISADRVRALIQSGRLPAHKLSREWAIMRSDLDPVRDRRPGRPRRVMGSSIESAVGVGATR
jgi:excisionase family DNA binding protein